MINLLGIVGQNRYDWWKKIEKHMPSDDLKAQMFEQLEYLYRRGVLDGNHEKVAEIRTAIGLSGLW